MKTGQSWLVVAGLLLWIAVPASGATGLLKGAPEATLKIYERYESLPEPERTDPKLVGDLEAAPGADLCFFDAATLDTAGPHQIDQIAQSFYHLANVPHCQPTCPESI